MKCAAIIPAAGLGTRMGKATEEGGRKQFLMLGDAPVFIQTLRRFDEAATIDELLIAVREGDRAAVAEQLRRTPIAKPIRIVVGGANRQDSVGNCLDQVSDAVDLVAVHDAVRPLIAAEMIDAAVEQAASDGAVILGMPAVDTVKQVDQRRVYATLPRERIMLAQTPQVFNAGLLRRAYEQAKQDGFAGTDEASLVEHLGEEVRVMLGSSHNIKITRPEDLALARFYFEGPAGGGAE